jgi:hypothetical protein
MLRLILAVFGRRSKTVKPSSMACRIVRPYAIVEAYTAQGTRVLPTVVYSEDQVDVAMERYAQLGCCTIVATPIH